MSMMMVQVEVMCCKSVGTDLSMLDIDDLMTEISQLKKEVKLLETKLRERDQLNRKEVCGVSLRDFTDQTSPDLLLSVCNEEQKTSVKLLDCEMEMKTHIKKEQTDEGDEIYSDLMEVKEESSGLNEIEEEPHHLIFEEESLSCLNTKQNFTSKNSQIASDKQSPSCPQCGKIFTHKSKLSRHMRIHTGERPYICDQCGMTFTSNFHLKRHMKIHTGERSYRCEQCGRTFTRKDHLKDHMRLHNGEKSHHYCSCGRSFKDSTRLETHRKFCQESQVHLRESVRIRRSLRSSEDVCGVSLCDFTDQTSPDLLLSVCNEEQKTSVKLLDCEMELKTEIKEEQTDEDDVIYSNLMEVKEESSEPNEKEEKPHRVITGVESVSCLNTEMKLPQKKSLFCPQCGKIFTQKSKLSRHMRIHTGERPYTCDQCGMTFTSNFHLKRHMIIHTGERSYRCEQCGRTFTRNDHLKDHMRLHNGENSHHCSSCGRSFKDSTRLETHMKKCIKVYSHETVRIRRSLRFSGKRVKMICDGVCR